MTGLLQGSGRRTTEDLTTCPDELDGGSGRPPLGLDCRRDERSADVCTRHTIHELCVIVALLICNSLGICESIT